MIAYFALLSFVPLTFLALALLGLTGRADESSFLVREIKQALPETPIEDIVRLVRTVQDNAWSLGIVGGAFLLWTSLSLFSVLESAFNIVYGGRTVPSSTARASRVALLMGWLVTLFVALLRRLVRRPGAQALGAGVHRQRHRRVRALGGVSTLGVFAFLARVYYVLTNERLRLRDVLPGAISARCCSRRASRSSRSSCATPSSTRC